MVTLRSPDGTVAAATVLYVALLAVLPLVLSEPHFEQMFSEDGPFEQVAIAAWLLAALLIVVRIRPLGGRACAFALAFVVFAAREADWHKAFTAGSMLKANYYLSSGASIGEKAAAFVSVIVITALLIYVGTIILRYLLRRDGWHSRAGVWLLFSVLAMALSKMLDRLPAVLAVDYAIPLSPLIRHYLTAYEEGLEMLVPLTWAWAIVVGQAAAPYLFRQEGVPALKRAAVAMKPRFNHAAFKH